MLGTLGPCLIATSPLMPARNQLARVHAGGRGLLRPSGLAAFCFWSCLPVSTLHNNLSVH